MELHREIHQITETTVTDENRGISLVCSCGRKVTRETHDEATQAWDRHIKARMKVLLDA